MFIPASDNCYGGIARLVSAVRDFKRKEENVVFLNGGDFYSGNVWYTHFKWRVVAHFGNILNFTAMVSVGVRERARKLLSVSTTTFRNFFKGILDFCPQALGNHEFDDHVGGLVPFLKNVSFPVVAANIGLSKEAALKGKFLIKIAPNAAKRMKFDCHFKVHGVYKT